MSSQITVFRSADESASEDADRMQRMLQEEGIGAVLLDDSAPGVPEGAYEVRVDAENQGHAEQLIAASAPAPDGGPGDPSHALDMVTVFKSAGSGGEMEALSIQSMLEAGGISAILVGDSRYPIFPQEVRVAREQETSAKRMIQEALAAGSVGAEEAEASGEKE